MSLRDLFRTQLRAILRAADGQSISIMFPMVSSLTELREAKALLAEAAAELRCPTPRIGIMIEVPAAVAIAAFTAGVRSELWNITPESGSNLPSRSIGTST